jgi:glycosyltransferase involved in cell wall biosynthesis
LTRPLVLVDADVLGRRRTGDESYVENLLRELGGMAQDLRIGAVTRHPENLPPGVEAHALPAQRQLLRMSLTLPRLLHRVRPAVAHFQYAIPPLSKGKAVVTVHDLSFERRPELMSRRDRILFGTAVPASLRRAARVLTGSEWTKRDLLERYGLAEEKVVVTPYGVDPAFGPNGARSKRSPYLLAVGAIQPRKDPFTLLEAFSRLDADLLLVFAGPVKRGGDEVRHTIARLRLEHRVELAGYVEKTELAKLYRAAACVVLPSLYEGFGLPVLEAMASGTPVVATRVAAIPEVAGEAAVLVDPGDPVALAAGIQRALSERETLVVAGLDRAREFTWTETARRTLDVYRELV